MRAPPYSTNCAPQNTVAWTSMGISTSTIPVVAFTPSASSVNIWNCCATTSLATHTPSIQPREPRPHWSNRRVLLCSSFFALPPTNTQLSSHPMPATRSGCSVSPIPFEPVVSSCCSSITTTPSMASANLSVPKVPYTATCPSWLLNCVPMNPISSHSWR